MVSYGTRLAALLLLCLFMANTNTVFGSFSSLTPQSSTYFPAGDLRTKTVVGSGSQCAWTDVDLGINDALASSGGGDVHFFAPSAPVYTGVKLMGISDDGATSVVTSSTGIHVCEKPFSTATCYLVKAMSMGSHPNCNVLFNGAYTTCRFSGVFMAGDGLSFVGGWIAMNRILSCYRTSRSEQFTSARCDERTVSPWSGGARYQAAAVVGRGSLDYSGLWYPMCDNNNVYIYKRASATSTSWSLFQTIARRSTSRMPYISSDALTISFSVRTDFNFAGVGYIYTRTDLASQFTQLQAINNPAVALGYIPKSTLSQKSYFGGVNYDFWGGGFAISGDGRTAVGTTMHWIDEYNCESWNGMIAVFTRTTAGSTQFSLQNMMKHRRTTHNSHLNLGHIHHLSLSNDGLVLTFGHQDDVHRASYADSNRGNTENLGAVWVCARGSITEEFDFEVNCQILHNPLGNDGTNRNVGGYTFTAGQFGVTSVVSGDGSTLLMKSSPEAYFYIEADASGSDEPELGADADGNLIKCVDGTCLQYDPAARDYTIPTSATSPSMGLPYSFGTDADGFIIKCMHGECYSLNGGGNFSPTTRIISAPLSNGADWVLMSNGYEGMVNEEGVMLRKLGIVYKFNHECSCN